MSSTRIRRHVRAPWAIVYRALLDPRVVAKWKVPAGMTCRVHSFEARLGGSISTAEGGQRLRVDDRGRRCVGEEVVLPARGPRLLEGTWRE